MNGRCNLSVDYRLLKDMWGIPPHLEPVSIDLNALGIITIALEGSDVPEDADLVAKISSREFDGERWIKVEWRMIPSE